MGRQLTWDEIVAMDLVGCDMESQEMGEVYRGPIAEVKKGEGAVAFKFAWAAHMVINPPSGWKKWDILEGTVALDCVITPPKLDDLGRIMWQDFVMGLCIIFPKNGSHLDPASVEGLDLSGAKAS